MIVKEITLTITFSSKLSSFVGKLDLYPDAVILGSDRLKFMNNLSDFIEELNLIVDYNISMAMDVGTTLLFYKGCLGYTGFEEATQINNKQLFKYGVLKTNGEEGFAYGIKPETETRFFENLKQFASELLSIKEIKS